MNPSQRCPACNCNYVSHQWPVARLGGKKSILWCGKCGFGWQHPLPTPDEIHRYYEDFSTYNIHGAGEKEIAFSRRMRRIKELKPNRGQLLDIGSGLGHFLMIAKDGGWDVEGVEPQHCAAVLNGT